MHIRSYVIELLKSLLIVCVLVPNGAHSALIELEPTSIFAGNGESISVDLVVDGLGNFAPDSLGAFDVSVDFDPAVLSLSGYSLGGFLGDISVFEALDASEGDLGGRVNVAEISLLSDLALDVLQPARFVIATLDFDVIDIDAGEVSLLSILPDALLADGFGIGIDISSFGRAEIEGRKVVPLPSTILMVILGIIALYSARLRQSSIY